MSCLSGLAAAILFTMPKGKLSHLCQLLPDDAVEHPLREVPAEALVFTLPSRYCQSDLLTRMARGESVNSRPVAGESERSPTGSASTSSTITGRPTPKRRRSIRRRSGSASAATSRIW